MQQNERQLLHAMYEEYLVPLKKYAAKLGVHYDDIEDLVHEVFLEYLERYPLDWDDRAKTAMLLRILHSRWADLNRKRRRYEVVSIDDPDKEDQINLELKDSETVTHILEREVLDGIMFNQICDVIKEMKRDWRDVLILKLVAHMTSAEICQMLNISDTVLRKRLSRARQDLQKRLKKAGITDR